MPNPPELPGFYYDEEKKKYFKITNGALLQNQAYHNNSVEANKRKRDFQKNITIQEEQSKKLKQQNLQDIAKRSKHYYMTKTINKFDNDPLNLTSRKLGLMTYNKQQDIFNSIQSCKLQYTINETLELTFHGTFGEGSYSHIMYSNNMNSIIKICKMSNFLKWIDNNQIGKIPCDFTFESNTLNEHIREAGIDDPDRRLPEYGNPVRVLNIVSNKFHSFISYEISYFEVVENYHIFIEWEFDNDGKINVFDYAKQDTHRETTWVEDFNEFMNFIVFGDVNALPIVSLKDNSLSVFGPEQGMKVVEYSDHLIRNTYGDIKNYVESLETVSILNQTVTFFQHENVMNTDKTILVRVLKNSKAHSLKLIEGKFLDFKIISQDHEFGLVKILIISKDEIEIHEFQFELGFHKNIKFLDKLTKNLPNFNQAGNRNAMIIENNFIIRRSENVFQISKLNDGISLTKTFKLEFDIFNYIIQSVKYLRTNDHNMLLVITRSKNTRGRKLQIYW